MNKDKRTKSIRRLADQDLLAGIKKHLGKTGTLVVEQTKYTGAELATMLQERLDAVNAADDARATWSQLVRAAQQRAAETDHVLNLARQALAILYGGSDQVLRDFGLSPKKAPRALTVKELSDKIGKAKATRKAREPVTPPTPTLTPTPTPHP
jgi:hypothetical protein